MSGPNLVNPVELAAMLGVKRRMAQYLISQHTRAIRLGSQWFLTAADARALKESRASTDDGRVKRSRRKSGSRKG